MLLEVFPSRETVRGGKKRGPSTMLGPLLQSPGIVPPGTAPEPGVGLIPKRAKIVPISSPSRPAGEEVG